MTDAVSMAMRVVDEWSAEYPHTHFLTFNRRIKLNKEQALQLATIANDARFVSSVKYSNDSTTFKVLVMPGTDVSSMSRLRAVIFHIAEAASPDTDKIEVVLAGRMEPFWLYSDRLDTEKAQGEASKPRFARKARVREKSRV